MKPGKVFQPLGVDLKLKRPPEPTNILWQNLHSSKQETKWRERKMFVVVAIVLALFFATVYSFKKNVVELVDLFPEVNCQDLSALYSTELY